MAILKDLAGEAGVSMQTVSRVMNGQGQVREETRRRVLAVARKLAYTPHRAARSLRTHRSYEIAIVMRTTHEPYLRQIAGLDEVLRGAGYSLTILFDPTPDRKAAARSMEELVRNSPAAVVLLERALPLIQAQVAALREAGLPYIVMNMDPDGFDSVTVDRPAGAAEAVRYLAERGHERIAYMGNRNASWDRPRSDGYCGAMKELGRAPEIIDLACGSDESLYVRGRAAGRAFPQTASRPDSVLIFSVDAAMGFMAGLHDVRLHAPEDVAVVSFGNNAATALASPPITAVDVPNREIGAAAGEILLKKIAGGPAPAGGWSRTLKTRLIVRESA